MNAQPSSSPDAHDEVSELVNILSTLDAFARGEIDVATLDAKLGSDGDASRSSEFSLAASTARKYPWHARAPR